MTEPKQLSIEYIEHIWAMDTITLQPLLSTFREELYTRPDFGFICDNGIWKILRGKGQT